MDEQRRPIRVVETMDVTAETLEKIINEMHGEATRSIRSALR